MKECWCGLLSISIRDHGYSSIDTRASCTAGKVVREMPRQPLANCSISPIGSSLANA